MAYQNISKVASPGIVADLPVLTREYKKLAKIQSALSTKLKRELSNNSISAYNAGCTLVSLYNGISKLESLRDELATASIEKSANEVGVKDDGESPEVQRAAETLVSVLARDMYANEKP